MRFFSRVLVVGVSIPLAFLVGCSQIQSPVLMPDEYEVIYHWQSTPDSRAERAFLAYREKAERGDPVAQFILGEAYSSGSYRGNEATVGIFNGVVLDNEHAFFWYNKAARNGLAVAQYKLGTFYQHGLGVAKDWVKAATWFRKASDQGNSLAQDCLGLCYAYGLGVDKNQIEAYAYRSLAEPEILRTPQGEYERDRSECNFYLEATGELPVSPQSTPFVIKSWMNNLSPGQIVAGKIRAKELQEVIDKSLAKIKAGK